MCGVDQPLTRCNMFTSSWRPKKTIQYKYVDGLPENACVRVYTMRYKYHVVREFSMSSLFSAANLSTTFWVFVLAISYCVFRMRFLLLLMTSSCLASSDLYCNQRKLNGRILVCIHAHSIIIDKCVLFERFYCIRRASRLRRIFFV